jgi:hypothetical protein
MQRLKWSNRNKKNLREPRLFSHVSIISKHTLYHLLYHYTYFDLVWYLRFVILQSVYIKFKPLSLVFHNRFFVWNLILAFYIQRPVIFQMRRFYNHGSQNNSNIKPDWNVYDRKVDVNWKIKLFHKNTVSRQTKQNKNERLLLAVVCNKSQSYIKIK